jgi:hypothetical protein
MRGRSARSGGYHPAFHHLAVIDREPRAERGLEREDLDAIALALPVARAIEHQREGLGASGDADLLVELPERRIAARLAAPDVAAGSEW